MPTLPVAPPRHGCGSSPPNGRLRGGLRRSARRLDAWTLARDKAAADRNALLAMSERELRDIGIDASQIRAVTNDHWVRDWGA